MRRISRTVRRDYSFTALCTIADRQVPIDVEARLNSNGIFTKLHNNKD